MSTCVRATVLAALFAIVLPSIACAGDTVELFNGKDLTGWTKRGGKAKYRVENGEIVGTSVPNTVNTFLCTDKDYGDFELEYDFKILNKDFNSGVQIRSHARPENDHQRVYGYQIEIDPSDRAWSGGLYYEGGYWDKEASEAKGKQVVVARKWLEDLKGNDAARKAFKFGEWNHVKVIAKGRRIQSWINGVPAADYTDNDKKMFAPSGFIALQVHAVGKKTEPKEVHWKDIKLTELD